MRGSFIIHAMIDASSGRSFHAAISPDTFKWTAHSADKHCSPKLQKLGVGFQLPFSKPCSVVHIVLVLGKWLFAHRKVYNTTLKCSWAVLTCFSTLVSMCLSLSILKQIALSSLFSIFSNPLTLTPITQRAPVASFQPQHWS